ncbi:MULTISPECIES: iron ABC transporter substrate-binding protein [unclassified Methanoregula]|uniref:iron ABC transporter substrate-binding protein n=1 Tax=unclassified Methanoregula TaxID=2649730 RepID=UPI0009CBE7F2|nr:MULTISPECIES: iron ABC transporter substrate-binding protein [unclassified Methanoregula]OPX64382.1 MAG: corrinoid ABC transporter substrate-binding protein [Methanoregula sp. PtaB.Bin085]OPY34948.1 MAG: corrinoid ABC transporter substrate-binding protein [Methanoregula sp. PtaU1.Bin006]
MKKTWMSFIIVTTLILAFAVCAGCTGNASPSPTAATGTPASSATTTITDGYGRNVVIPSNPDKIICSGAGCLRYVVYLGAQDKVVGVDSIEKKAQSPEGRAYSIANPQFSSLPLFGEMRGKDDPEKIIGIGPQVVFKSGSTTSMNATSAAEADTLQNKTGIPVIGFPYGSLRTPAEKADMYNSLRLIGKTLGKDARAEELIAYIDATTADLERRTKDIPADQQKTVYIGGVSSAGAHGIISTEPAYPPFLWVHAKNIAAQSGSQHADISKEVIVSGDPEYLFIDVGTTQMDNEGAIGELKTNAAYSSLKSVKNGNVYGVLPYNFYSTNYETVLADSYYIGKVLYPDRFADVDPKQKADEIYTKFVGKPVFSTLNGNYRNLGFAKITL